MQLVNGDVVPDLVHCLVTCIMRCARPTTSVRASDRENSIVYLYTTILGMAVAVEAVQGNAAGGCSVFNGASLHLCSCCTCQLHVYVAGDTSVFNGASLHLFSRCT